MYETKKHRPLSLALSCVADVEPVIPVTGKDRRCLRLCRG